MLNSFLRTIGAACIIAGAVLYFTNLQTDDAEIIAENKNLHSELDSLRSLLQETEAELANLQTLTANAEKSADELQNEQEQEGAGDHEDAITKTVLLIEPGTTSKDVANALEQSAIIHDADEFNSYLTEHDLSGKVQIGEYNLDSSMSIETIAKHITTLN